jgi:hypothetical protein
MKAIEKSLTGHENPGVFRDCAENELELERI